MARMLNRRQTLAGLALGCATGGRAFAQADDEPDSWPELVHLFFNDAPIQEDKSLVSFEAPARAEDAAIVPMSFSAKLPEGDTRRVIKLTLVIDENPVPLAAAFTLGEKAGDTRISTRVRVNSYTNTRVVAELSDGSLHMATRYIKASGGCSAPMVKSMDEALATLGQMKFRILPPTPEAPNEALLMVRHPNNSGLQMDQVTRLYTPARYIASSRSIRDRISFSRWPPASRSRRTRTSASPSSPTAPRCFASRPRTRRARPFGRMAGDPRRGVSEGLLRSHRLHCRRTEKRRSRESGVRRKVRRPSATLRTQRSCATRDNQRRQGRRSRAASSPTSPALEPRMARRRSGLKSASSMTASVPVVKRLALVSIVRRSEVWPASKPPVAAQLNPMVWPGVSRSTKLGALAPPLSPTSVMKVAKLPAVTSRYRVT